MRERGNGGRYGARVAEVHGGVQAEGGAALPREGARLLFQVMSDCYEKRSVIVTTNIEFSKWGTVLGDDKLAAATIDRLVHHGRLVEFGGPSKRMDAALMLGKS